MKISDLMKMGLRNLGRRKARTALTIVGIVIGTISIVVMVSIGIGMNQAFRESIMEYGSVTTITLSRSQPVFNEKGGYESSKEQKIDDKLIAKLKLIPHIKTLSPLISMNVKLKNGNYETNQNISIMDASSLEAFDFPALKNGETYNKSHSRSKIKIWAGESMFDYFMDPTSPNYREKKIDPVKDRVTISIWDYDNLEYDNKGKLKFEPRPYSTEIAVFDANPYSEYGWSMYMDKAQFEIMYKEYLKLLPIDKRKKAEKKLKEYNSIRINADSVENVESIQEAIKELGYNSTSMSDMTKQIESTSKTMQMVLGGVGAVSMIVAAISIANTMVMSIYERTKEIGVMKVLGCHLIDIKKLFLFEAAMMGLIGGVIGIALSYAASYALNTFGSALGNALNLLGGETSSKLSIIPFWLPFVASLFAIGIGIVSGYYPASRATKISAIEAMKNE